MEKAVLSLELLALYALKLSLLTIACMQLLHTDHMLQTNPHTITYQTNALNYHTVCASEDITCN